MKQQELQTKSLSQIGEEIEKELASKMVKDFHDSFPKEQKGFYIGRNILEKILSQPDCVGIRYYNALNENNEKTVVYVGIDSNDEIIIEYPAIDAVGDLVMKEGIVADRVTTIPKDPDNPWIQAWF